MEIVGRLNGTDLAVLNNLNLESESKGDAGDVRLLLRPVQLKRCLPCSPLRTPHCQRATSLYYTKGEVAFPCPGKRRYYYSMDINRESVTLQLLLFSAVF